MCAFEHYLLEKNVLTYIHVYNLHNSLVGEKQTVS